MRSEAKRIAREKARCPVSAERMTSEAYSTFEKELFELNDIPEEMRSALSYYAYEKGHSAGYDECFGILQGLVGDFKDSIHKLMARCRAEKK